MFFLASRFNFDSVRLTLIGESDIEATVAMINKAFSYQDKAKGKPRIDSESLRRKTSEADFYVAKQNEKIVGCVYVESQGVVVHFGLLAVADSHRGKGLAASIMVALEGYSKSIGADKIELDYMSEAPWLKRYYEGYGYVENGQITPWGTIDLIRMEKPIRSV